VNAPATADDHVTGKAANGFTLGRDAATPSRGFAVAAMCAGVLLLAVNDALAKWLVERYAPFQIILVRSLVALPLVVGLVLWLDGRQGLRSARPGVHAWRGLLAVAATCAFFLSLRALPLAEATSLLFAAPLFVAALSAPLLREKVGEWQWGTVAAGFAGVLIVARPGAQAFQPASLLALAAAALYALVMISARWIDRHDGARTVMVHLTLSSVLLSGFAVFSTWPEPRALDALLFLGMAVAGTLGVTLITQAFRTAPAAAVAPFEYTSLVWASLLGWLVWSEAPDAWTYAGAAVIIASGTALMLRARQANG
jgi:drug/metabolite transporter (DMT)-like permease